MAGLMAFPFSMVLADPPPSNTATDGPTAFNIIIIIGGILNVIIPVLITLGVVYVIYGVIKYATAKESGEQEEARKTIISGIIALFVIVSIWGLVAILNSTFGIGQGGVGLGPDCIPGTMIGYESNVPVFCE